jgi:hypothetical protein
LNVAPLNIGLITTNPGGFVGNFSNTTTAYAVYTAYGYININGSAGPNAIVVVNGINATTPVNVSLTATPTAIQIYAISKQFGCAVGANNYTITASQSKIVDYNSEFCIGSYSVSYSTILLVVSPALVSATTTGLLQPNFNSSYNTYSIYGYPTVGLGLQSTPQSACVVNLNGVVYACNATSLQTLTVGNNATVALFAQFDRPRIYNNYTFSLQLPVCSKQSQRRRGVFDGSIPAYCCGVSELVLTDYPSQCTTTTADYLSYQSACDIQTTDGIVSFSYVNTSDCGAPILQYNSSEGNWVNCVNSTQCLLNAGLNVYQLVLPNLLDAQQTTVATLRVVNCTLRVQWCLLV